MARPARSALLIAILFSFSVGEISATEFPPFTVRGRLAEPLDISYVYDVSDCPLDAKQSDLVLELAMRAWEETGVVRFRRAEPDETADVTFSWQPADHAGCDPFIGWCGVLAHAGPMGDTTFVHFNRDVRWSLDDHGKYGFYQAALHEIGHVLGLDHSPLEYAVMHVEYDRRARSLTAADLAGVHSLYGKGDRGAGDVEILAPDVTGGAVRTRTVLRGIAPPGEVDTAILDVDGDGRDELLTWPTDANPLTGGVTVYHFDAELRLEHTRGTTVNFTHAKARKIYDRETGGAALAVLVFEDGTYRARVFGETGLPQVKWPPEKPLELECGFGDADGDGRFEVPETPPLELKVYARGYAVTHPDDTMIALVDLDGRVNSDVLVREADSSSHRWILRQTSDNRIRHRVGPRITAHSLRHGDLDGDGKAELAVVRPPLPDPLVFVDGRSVKDSDDWRERRSEIVGLFEEHVYGRVPQVAWRIDHEVTEAGDAFGGRARRKQVRLTIASDAGERHVDILIYLPRADGPVPLFLGLNFYGNHTIQADPAIQLSKSWMRANDKMGVVDNRATESSRGKSASRWPIDAILERGYGLATIYYGDLDPDFDDGFRNGVHELVGSSGTPRRGDAWGSIATWAWGSSRALDYFEADADIDQARVAVLGHSRLGKTALWAGATDERFAVVISNDSGCGGAALSRRRSGETVARINKSFPHWFCGNFRRYDDNEDALPVDQHMLMALVAPRPLYVASAEQDAWADPRGEFLSLAYALPIYRLLGRDDLIPTRMPEVDEPVAGVVGYHLRRGKHDITTYDWERYLDFADRHLGE